MDSLPLSTFIEVGDSMGLIYGELSEQIIKSFYHVFNSLGSGFLEKVYENALMVLFEENGISAQAQTADSGAFSWSNRRRLYRRYSR